MAVCLILTLLPATALAAGDDGAPTASGVNFFANGTPITISADAPEDGTEVTFDEFTASGQDAYISWDEDGTTKYVGVSRSLGVSVYGGGDGSAEPVTVSSTSITMTGGKVWNVYGGNLGMKDKNAENCSTVTGDVTMQFSGDAEVWNLLHGGGAFNTCVEGTVYMDFDHATELNKPDEDVWPYINGGVYGNGSEGSRDIENGEMDTYAVVNRVEITATGSNLYLVGAGGSGSTKVLSGSVVLNNCTVGSLYLGGINGEIGDSSITATNCEIESISATNRGFVGTGNVDIYGGTVGELRTGAGEGCFDTDSGKPDGSGVTGECTWNISADTTVDQAFLTPLVKRDKDDDYTSTFDGISIQKEGEPLTVTVEGFRTTKNTTVTDFAVSNGATLTMEGVNAKVEDGVTFTNAGTVEMTAGTTLTVAGSFENMGAVNGADVVTDGSGSVTECVAKVGSTGYTTLQKALDAAQDGETVELLQDVHVTSTSSDANQAPALTIKTGITLEGNGCTIYAENFTTGGNDGTSAINSILDVNASDVRIYNLNIVGDGTAKHGVNAYCVDDVIIDGVSVTGAAGYALVVNSSNVVVEDMTTSGNGWGSVNVESKDSTKTSGLEIKGGTFEDLVSVKVEQGASAPVSTVTIADGEFSGWVGIAASGTGSSIQASGGTFTQTLDKAYIVPGMKWDETTGGIVMDPNAGEGEKIAAMIDGKTYTSLQAAVADAEDGDVVKVFPGNHDLSYDGNYDEYLLKIDDSITLMGVDYNGDPITDATKTMANIYSTDYVANGSFPQQNLITVAADDVTIQGLTIMNKDEPNKAIEVIGPADNFVLQNCVIAPTSSDLDPDAAQDRGGLVYLNGNNSDSNKITATIQNNIFKNSGLYFGSVVGGTFTVEGNQFNGNLMSGGKPSVSFGYINNWNGGDGIGDATISVDGNTFKDIAYIWFPGITDPESNVPVFGSNQWLDANGNPESAEAIAQKINGTVKTEDGIYVDSQEALEVALENANDGDTIVLADSFTITSAVEVTKDLTIDGNGNTITADQCVGFYIKDDLKTLVVKDLTLKGTPDDDEIAGEGGSGSFMGIGTYNGCYGVEDLQLNNVTIDGFSYGLYFGSNTSNDTPVSVDAEDLTIQNCYIKGAYFEKLTDSTFTDCQFIDNGTDADKVEANFQKWVCGVDVNLKYGDYQDIKFDGCTFTGNGDNSGTALHIKARDDGKTYGADPATLDGVTVTGCTFKDNNAAVKAPIVLGEPDANNETPVNVYIQPDVDYINNLAKDAYVTISFYSAGGDPVPSIVAEKGGQIKLPTCTRDGNYSFVGWWSDTKTYDAGETITVNEDMTFTAQWHNESSSGGSSSGGSSSSSGDYSITVDAGKHGDVSVSPKRADKGDTVTITVDPDKGYEVDEVIVTDKDGDTIRVKDRGDGEYTFTMPDSKVTVEVTFVEASGELSFVDVAKSDYYYDAVKWAVENGVTTGVTDTIFAPGNPCTRAQTVTFLWRAAGMPQAANRVNPFTDVSVNDYYYEAVLWAVENGITGGTTATTFSPNATCTRAQVVTFLWRYSKEDASILPMFTDVAESDYYYGAVAWAVENGVTTGVTDTTFAPGNPCTRGQIVTFLYRYMGK